MRTNNISPLPLPWILLSPLMIVHTVRSTDDLDALADHANVPRSNFKQLVGINKNTSAGLPQHKGGWQVLQKLRWVMRSATPRYGPAVAPMPVVGASGNEFVRDFADVVNDKGINGKTLWSFATVGTGSRRPAGCEGCEARSLPDHVPDAKAISRRELRESGVKQCRKDNP